MVDLSRRRVLAAGVGGLALVAAGGVFRVTRQPSTAFGPWDLDPTPPADVRLDAFRHAILAPNPHNRQPWLIRLIGDDAAIITCDLDRLLPATDPYDRQTVIGFGTFLEIARIAAAERGFAMKIDPFPEGFDDLGLDGRPVARLQFAQSSDQDRDPLFAQIVKRRSNKEEYDVSRKVPSEILAHVCRDGANFTREADKIAEMRNEIVGAITTEMTTHETNMESVELMRIGHEEVDANPDGIELYGPMIEAGKLVGMVNRKELADPASSGFRQGLDMMQATYGSIPALVWISTPANTRIDQLEAGRRYVRANLEATALGLGMHPMSQSLQEYAEVRPMYDRVHALLGAAGKERVQMLARIGYAPESAPTPRWPLETHIQ